MSTTSQAHPLGFSGRNDRTFALAAMRAATRAGVTLYRHAVRLVARHRPTLRRIALHRIAFRAFAASRQTLPVSRLAFIALLVVTALPAARNVHAGELRHGVNLSHWFEQEGRAPVSAADFTALREAGFDHVRIPVNPARLGWSPTQPEPSLTIAPLADAIRSALDAGLDVIVDVAPDEADRARVEADHAAFASYTRVAQTLAHMLAGFPANRVFLEPLNEPQFYGWMGASRWQTLQGQLIADIRTVAPHLTLIVMGRQGGSLEGLEELTAYRDPNLIYSFHYYLPYIFTHQGAPWMRDDAGTTAGLFSHVLYPSQLAQQTPPFERNTPDASQRMNAELTRYESDDWRAARIAAYLRPAFQLAQQRGIRIVCTEFGVLRDNVDPPSRDRWLHDVSATLDSMGIGWTVWDYTDAFGITLTDAPSGARRLDPAVLKALGLNGARP